MEDTFVVVTFPDCQMLMDLPGFGENACLVNDEPFLTEYGSSAFFVRQSWLPKISTYNSVGFDIGFSDISDEEAFDDLIEGDPDNIDAFIHEEDCGDR